MRGRRVRDMRAALLRKGFIEREGGDHTKYFFHFEGRKTSLWTKLSRGVREYGDPLLAQVAKQLRLSRRESDDLFDCPLDESGYEKLMIERGHIRP